MAIRNVKRQENLDANSELVERIQQELAEKKEQGQEVSLEEMLFNSKEGRNGSTIFEG